MKRVAIAASLLAVFTAAADAAYDRYGNYYEPSREYRASDFDRRDREYFAATREECFNTRTGRYENRPETSNRIGGGAVVGAIAGGVLGHQVGSGRGNDAATVGGALLGGLLGHKVEKDRRDDHPDFDMNRCRTVAAYDSGQSYSSIDNSWR